jgi:hypothetical protein
MIEARSGSTIEDAHATSEMSAVSKAMHYGDPDYDHRNPKPAAYADILSEKVPANEGRCDVNRAHGRIRKA